MTDDELHRQVEELAAQLHAGGYLVTLDRAVEPAGIVRAMEGDRVLTTDQLRRWREQGAGPPCRKHGYLLALYPLDDFLRWQEAQRAERGRYRPSVRTRR